MCHIAKMVDFVVACPRDLREAKRLEGLARAQKSTYFGAILPWSLGILVSLVPWYLSILVFRWLLLVPW